MLKDEDNAFLNWYHSDTIILHYKYEKAIKAQAQALLADAAEKLAVDEQDYLALFQQAIVYYVQGEHETAQLLFETCREQNDEPRLLYYMGRNLVFLGRHEEALEIYEAALKVDPLTVAAWHGKGNVLNDLKLYEDALNVYNQALEIDEQDAVVWNEIGITLYYLKRYEDALIAFNNALKIDEQFVSAWNGIGITLYYLKRHEDALSAFNRALDIDEQFVYAWHGKGNVLNDLKRYEEALNAYDKALEINEQDPVAWYGKGNVLRNLKRYEEALDAYTKALELDEQNFKAWNGKGNVLDDLKRYKEALNAFNKALEIDEQIVEAWCNKGIMLKNLKCYEEALNSFNEALKIDEHFVHARHGKGIVLNNLKRYEEALNAYTKALELDEHFVYAWNGKGNVLTNLKRYEEALNAYTKALELDEQDADVWNNKGNVLRSLKRYEEALNAYNKALELDEQNFKAWNGKGVIFGQLNRDEKAIDSFRTAIKIEPNLLEAHFNLLILFFQTERWEEFAWQFHHFCSLNVSIEPQDVSGLIHFCSTEEEPMPWLGMRVVWTLRERGFWFPLNATLSRYLRTLGPLQMQLLLCLDALMEEEKMPLEEQIEAELRLHAFTFTVFTPVADWEELPKGSGLLSYGQLLQVLMYRLGDPGAAFRLWDQWLRFYKELPAQVHYYSIIAARDFLVIELVIEQAVDAIDHLPALPAPDDPGYASECYYRGLLHQLLDQDAEAIAAFGRVPAYLPAALWHWYHTKGDAEALCQRFPEESQRWLRGHDLLELSGDFAGMEVVVMDFAHISECEEALYALQDALNVPRPRLNKPMIDWLYWSEEALEAQEKALQKSINRRTGDEYLAALFSQLLSPDITPAFTEQARYHEVKAIELFHDLQKFDTDELREQKLAEYLREHAQNLQIEGWLYLLIALYQRRQEKSSQSGIYWEQVIRLWFYHLYLQEMGRQRPELFEQAVKDSAKSGITAGILYFLPEAIGYKLLGLGLSALAKSLFDKSLQSLNRKYEHPHYALRYPSFLDCYREFIGELREKAGEQEALLREFMGVTEE